MENRRCWGEKKREKTVLGEGQRKQGDQRGGCCNIDVKMLGGKKTVFWENSPGNRGDALVCLSAKPQKQVFLLAFNLPRYHKSEGLSACYMLL